MYIASRAKNKKNWRKTIIRLAPDTLDSLYIYKRNGIPIENIANEAIMRGLKQINRYDNSRSEYTQLELIS